MSFYCALILYIQDSKDIISYKNTKSVLTKTRKLYIITLKVSAYLMWQLTYEGLEML